MPETDPDTVVHFYHHHGPTRAGRFEQWNPPVCLGKRLSGFEPLPEWVQDKLEAAGRHPEFAAPDGHWSRWWAIPREAAPRIRHTRGRFPGLKLDLATHPEVLDELRQDMAFAEPYFADTTPAGSPALYLHALDWLCEGESDAVMWARMVRHAAAAGVPHPRIASELGVELDRVYAVTADPWREAYLARAEHMQAAGAREQAQQNQALARKREFMMDPA